MVEGQPTPRTNRWYVYLVRCADGTLYTGITKDWRRRLKQHNAGTASRYTRSRRPVAMVFRETQKNHSLALRRELAIKAMSRREKIELCEKTKPRRTQARAGG